MLLLYRFWLIEICICCKPCPTRDETRDLQIALPTTFFYTSGNLHARHIRAIFELCSSLCSSLLARHFSFLSFGVAMKGIQFTQLRCHISFLSFTRLTICFLSSRGRLLNSRKRRLFRRDIQLATRCLFERWTPVGSPEAAVCWFCLSISLHLSSLIRSILKHNVLIIGGDMNAQIGKNVNDKQKWGTPNEVHSRKWINIP